MSAPTLLFCIGATKAGTTWLHDYLARHPSCRFRAVKETHWFDKVAAGEAASWADELMVTAEWMEREGAEKGDAELAACGRDHRELAGALRRNGGDPDDLVAWLVDGAGDARVVGDVTPAYALLPEETLAGMARLSGNVRFLYVLRDPVARLWSHVSMMAGRYAPDGQATVDGAKWVIERVFAGDETEIARRSDYAAVLDKIDRAVPAPQRRVIFYEDLMTPAGVDDLCDWLEIPRRAPDLDRRVHQGAGLPLADGKARKARRWLRPQYDYVTTYMGRLPASWAAERAEA